jgi:transporter family protein
MPAWLIYALLSALAAAGVGIFAKLGMQSVDSTLATIVRSMIMTAFLCSWGAVVGSFGKFTEISGKAIIAVVLSGLAGAVSWLFYFKAISVGKVSQVAAVDKLSMPFAVLLAVIFLQDKMAPVNWLGIGLMVAGAYLAIWK